MAETKKKEMGTGLFFEKLVKMVNRNDCFMLNLFQFEICDTDFFYMKFSSFLKYS